MLVKRLHLDLTDRCNLRCTYCFVPRGGTNRNAEMITEDWVRIVDQALEMGVRGFILSGGEPLLYPGFAEILRRIESAGAVVTIMSNLVGVPEHLVKLVSHSSAVKEVVTSLDGFTGHNLARQPSKWEEVVQLVKRLKQEGGEKRRIVINTVFHRHNTSEMEPLQHLVADLGVDVWRLDIPIKPTRADTMPDLAGAVEVAAQLIQNRYADAYLRRTEIVLFRVYKSRLEEISVDEAADQSDQSLHPCAYAFGRLTVKPNGLVTVCSPLQLSFGEVDPSCGNGLARVVAAVEQHAFFALRVDTIKGCKTCRYVGLCGAGCRADAMRWTGSAFNPDPVSCAMMPLVEKSIIPILSARLREIYAGLINSDGDPPAYRDIHSLERR